MSQLSSLKYSQIKSPSLAFNNEYYSPLIQNKIKIFNNSNQDPIDINLKPKNFYYFEGENQRSYCVTSNQKDKFDNQNQYNFKQTEVDQFKPFKNQILNNNRSTPSFIKERKLFEFSFEKDESNPINSSILVCQKINFDERIMGMKDINNKLDQKFDLNSGNSKNSENQEVEVLEDDYEISETSFVEDSEDESDESFELSNTKLMKKRSNNCIKFSNEEVPKDMIILIAFIDLIKNQLKEKFSLELSNEPEKSQIWRKKLTTQMEKFMKKYVIPKDLQSDFKKIQQKIKNDNLEEIKMSIKTFNSKLPKPKKTVIKDNYKTNKVKRKTEIILCPECHKEFQNGQSLGGHMSRIHPNKSKKYRQKAQVRENRTDFRKAIKEAKIALFKSHGFDYENLFERKQRTKIRNILRIFSSEYRKILDETKLKLTINKTLSYQTDSKFSPTPDEKIINNDN